MKQNFKKHKEGAVESTLYQIYFSTQPSYKIYEICKELLDEANDYERYIFVKTFNMVIREVNGKFLMLPVRLRDYFKPLFIQDLNSKYKKSMKDIKNPKLKSYLNCLYKTYIKQNVSLNWNEFRKTHWFMNQNWPYEVK